MNNVTELKNFAVLHARAQKITGYREILDRVRTDEGDAPGSWAREWSDAADALSRNERLLDACRHYNMARFPFVDSPVRQTALDKCVAAFDGWRLSQHDIQRLDIETDGGTASAWATGLSTSQRLPLLLVTGGIVSVKEQWAPALGDIRRLGMAAVVTEMPGVGENTARYTPESWRALSRILDAVADRADVSQTYALAMSFSGHMALRCALEDPRIRGVITAGAPVRHFFTDRDWHPQVPRITMDTLAHLTGVKPGELSRQLPRWALTDDELARLDVPVRYAVSQRDEIIPGRDAQLLRERVRDLRLRECDDVHGSPRHVTETVLWSVLSLLRMRNSLPARRTVMTAALAGFSLRRLFDTGQDKAN